MNILDLANALDKCFHEFGVLGFSVAVLEAPTLLEACKRANLPNPDVCWSTAAQVRGLDGVELLPTGTAPHHTIVLPDSDRGTVEAILDVFEGPVANLARPSK